MSSVANEARPPPVVNPSGASVRAQVVLYENSLPDVWRLMRGLSAAAREAKKAGALAWIEVCLGDCSATAALADIDVADLRTNLGDFDSFTYEFFGENLKSARGHNTLARNAATDFLLIINPDTYPAPTMLIHQLAAMADPLVGIAEARQIPLEHPKAFDLRTGDTSWASTCCVLVRHLLAFVGTGGFDDEHFPLYCDDVDFSWRVRLAGLRVVHVPRAVVFHDKQIGTDGHVAPGSVEVYEGTLGRLMLATKYARPDILKQTIDWIESDGVEAQIVALAEFRRRRSAGQTPVELVGAERVAQFEGGEYATHRF